MLVKRSCMLPEDGPSVAELASIEAEWPVIEAELALLDVQLAMLDRPRCEVDQRRLRRAARRVLVERVRLVLRLLAEVEAAGSEVA